LSGHAIVREPDGLSWAGIVPNRLKLAENRLVEQRTLWERRLDQLDEYLNKLKEKPT
jgi:hypothetical protein